MSDSSKTSIGMRGGRNVATQPANAVVRHHESRVTNHYDVLVAGASFAGLAVAQRLGQALYPSPWAEGRVRESLPPHGWRVALLDRAPVGDGVTSACGAPVSIVRAMGAEASIQLVHDRLVLHTRAGETVWPLPEPFCTFDYRRFCALAFAHAGVEFIQAAVTGRSGSTVRTSSGDFSGTVLVDATGWRAALAEGPGSLYVNLRWMAFGIESEVECAFEPGLHFYFLPEVRDGYAWAFPTGGFVRFGVLSYLGRSKLGPALERFMGRFGLRPRSVHGGFLASGLRPPVVDGVFVAGDASGHCLPLTGEGIRTAVLAGFTCGALIRRVLDGECTRDHAAAEYQTFIAMSRRKFRALMWANAALLVLPHAVIERAASWFSWGRPLRAIMQHYLGIFSDPSEAANAWPQ